MTAPATTADWAPSVPVAMSAQELASFVDR
ncbi:MAG: hypothetical protein JWM02_2448, partial [Frankiales bacterium]|nr:hypothetical protein [Frankiales bacterium]MCW2600619.1 hypothetical protein [Frankiales bacterium]